MKEVETSGIKGFFYINMLITFFFSYFKDFLCKLHRNVKIFEN